MSRILTRHLDSNVPFWFTEQSVSNSKYLVLHLENIIGSVVGVGDAKDGVLDARCQCVGVQVLARAEGGSGIVFLLRSGCRGWWVVSG